MHDVSKTVAMANPREHPEPEYYFYEPLSMLTPFVKTPEGRT